MDTFKIWFSTDPVSERLEVSLAVDTSSRLAVDCLENTSLKSRCTVKPTVATPSPGVPNSMSDVAITITERVELRQHRRVRHKDIYAKSVLDQVKLKFGTPTMSNANRMAVNRYAASIMEQHGVRTCDSVKLLPYIVALTFIPSDDEIMALQLVGCAGAVTRREAMGNHFTNRD